MTICKLSLDSTNGSLTISRRRLEVLKVPSFCEENIKVCYQLNRQSQQLQIADAGRSLNGHRQWAAIHPLVHTIMSAILPQELLDQIIDYLYHESRTLKQCSLASSLLLGRCRYHLFRVLKVG